jgi:prolyl oligopeptidase
MSGDGGERAMRLDYPAADPAPTTRTFGDVTFADPYAWLEEDSEPVLAWQARQDALAASFLAALPGHAAFAARVAALSAGQDVLAPRFGGGRWFRSRVPDGEDLAVIEVSESPTGPGRRVFDLNTRRGAEAALISWFSPSPDGRSLAFACGNGGRREESLRVVDVANGEVIADGMAPGRGGSPAWLPDGRGFYYRADDRRSGAGGSVILRHVLGEPPATRPEPLDLGHPLAWPVSAAGGRYVLVYSDHLEPRPEFILDTRGDSGWRPFLKGVSGSFRGVVVGDRFIAITNDGAPRGRLVSIPLASPLERDTWRELLAGSENVLASLVAVGGRLLLVELVDTYARLRVLSADGAVEGEIALPGRGVVNTSSGINVAIAFMECVSVGAGDEVVFVFSSLTRSPALYRASVVRRTCEPLTEPATRLDALVSDCSARSADGTHIPYRVVRPRDGDEHPRPTLVFVYGGFNVALVPGWPLPLLAAWVRSGGVLAIAHLRGGGELGPDWWRAGQLANKQNSFDDLYAVAEDMVARGVTTHAQLGVYGISSGGTVAAVAAVQRPGRFRAVAAQLPTTDQFGLVRDPISLMIAKMEDGDPDDATMSSVLRAWSPYQNVTDGVGYPAVLLDCGLDDPRCPAWHGRKLAARLQPATSSGRPVLLRARRNSGHRAVGDAAQVLQQTELLAFLANQLGLEP